MLQCELMAQKGDNRANWGSQKHFYAIMDYIIPIEVYSTQITLPQLGSTSLNIFSLAKTQF